MTKQTSPQYAVADNGCWLWQRSILNTGYGTTGKALAHRVYYEKFVGTIPAGFDIDHVCHNEDKSCRGGKGCLHRRCVNPNHLQPTTRSLNTRRGRVRKLTDKQVAEIIQLGKSLSLRKIATKFGVTHGTVYRIQNNTIGKK